MDLIIDYHLITIAYKLHRIKPIKEVVMMQRNKVISATDIKDISYVFGAKNRIRIIFYLW